MENKDEPELDVIVIGAGESQLLFDIRYTNTPAD